MAETCGGQTMESAAMAGNPPTQAVLAEWLLNLSKFFTSNVVGGALLSGFCHLLYICVAFWLWSQSVKIFKRIQKNQNGGQWRLSEAMNTNRILKDQIGRLEGEKGSKSEMNRESMIPLEGENPVNLAASVSVTVSDFKVKQKILEQTMSAEMLFDAIDIKVQRGCSILQSKVVLNHQSMTMLHNLAVEGSKKDEKFTVQLSRWRFFRHTAGEVKMLKLDDDHEVPTILHADYAAGKLTIQGFNLEGAEIKAATCEKCITLKDLTKEEVGRLEIWTSIVRLPSNNLDEVYVYATKPICIDDYNVIVRSSLINVQDDNLRAVLRVGIPSTIGLMYMIIMYMKLFCLDGGHLIAPTFVWILPLIAMALIQILPQSTENALEVGIERIGLATMVLYFATQRLFLKQDPKFVRNRIIYLPQGHSLEGSDYKKQDNSMDHTEKQAKVKGIEKKSKVKGIEKKFEKKEVKEKEVEKTDEEPQCFVYEEYIDEYGRMSVRKRDFEKKSTKTQLPFKFIYGLKTKMWNERDYFKFYSDSNLIQVLRKFLPEKFNLMGSKKVNIYASEFFHIRNELKEALDFFVEEISITFPEIDTIQLKAHIKYFCQFLDTTCQEVLGKYEIMKKEGCVSWDLLWAFFPFGSRVVYSCAITGEELCGLVQNIEYSIREQHGVLRISLKTWDYNCQTWTSYSKYVQRAIRQYSGSCKFTNLEIHPLQFKTGLDIAKKKFLAKGAWFSELSMQTQNRFMHYKGLMYRQTGCGISKDAVNGRVMIGLASFAKMNPNYPLESATPPSETLRTGHVELINISTKEDRMFAPNIVYGFSFQNKKWGAFNIDGFEEIVFNESAYDALVMDSRKKDTIYSLVHEYKRSDDTKEQEEQRIDPIIGKGEGCIFLCYGPPGTGKTFTAESISERLHAPLWSLSVSELGTTPKVLEEKLVRILDVAASWGAILLLDEADVYLEKRNTGTMDLERNAMTGIFLRNLEYYKGVLFLTTNRVVAFDDAFCSRISMFLYYGEHLEHDRRVIWKNLLEPLKIQDLADFLKTDYASFKLNAREIRNVVQVARTLAKTKGQNVNGFYLRHSLETLASSLLELKRVTGETQTSSFTGIPSS